MGQKNKASCGFSDRLTASLRHNRFVVNASVHRYERPQPARDVLLNESKSNVT